MTPTWAGKPHPDPRFCERCGHHADGHSEGRCHGLEDAGDPSPLPCRCTGYVGPEKNLNNSA